MKIEVYNCQKCPFCNIDNEYGYTNCNLDTDVVGYIGDNPAFLEMPSNGVHPDCPIAKGSATISIAKNRITVTSQTKTGSREHDIIDLKIINP